MQRLCHERIHRSLLGASLIGAAVAPISADTPVHDYPTQARVEYVNECIAKHSDRLATLYQCSCTIDWIANHLSYDDFVEASTFARYSGLPGEGGAIFRDSERAQASAKRYRKLEDDAHRACGLDTGG